MWRSKRRPVWSLVPLTDPSLRVAYAVQSADTSLPIDVL